MHTTPQQVLLFDKHLDGPYLELIKKAFSPNHPVTRHQAYKGKKVLFKRLIFHLESPAGLIFPKVVLLEPCQHTLPIRPNNIPYQPTLSSHPVKTIYPINMLYALATHPFDQHTLLTNTSF